MAFDVTTNFAGDVVQEIALLAAIQNQAVMDGHIFVSNDIRKQRSLPRMKMDQIIQDRKDTPDSLGTFTHDERLLVPTDFMVYVEFNPNDFRDVWDFMQSTNPFVFAELSPEVMRAVLEEVLMGTNGISPYMGKAIWQGDTAAGTIPFEKFNGIRKKAQDDTDVVDVVGTTITAANIIVEIEKVWEATPVIVRDNPGYKILVSSVTVDFYYDALIALANKGPAPNQLTEMRYKSAPVVGLFGMPDDVMFATVASSDRDSNIWLGLGWQEDFNQLQIEGLQANSELWFVKMLMSADTQIKFGEHFVLYE